jgi:choline dehydrogenase-like flavoprotein
MRFPEGSGADMEFLLGSTERTTGARYIPALWLSERGQRSTRAANVAFEVVPDGVGSSAADARANPAQIARASLGAMSRLPDWLSDSRAEAATYFRLVFRCESRPDPTNHVTLTDHLDALGVPRVKLSYRWQPADLASIAPALGLLAREFGERYGILVKQFAEPSEVVRTSFHQMGTTRMGADPGRSVVDAECRVHSCANLFVAGGSVFPSAGWVNPTMTIVALAIRLADLLKRVAKQ